MTQQLRRYPTFEDIRGAHDRIRPYLAPTPTEQVALPEEIGGEVWLKLESANPTHAFKVRGALNALLSLDEGVRARGIVTASTGNHAQGVAWAARIVGVAATIFMPENAARRKIASVRRLGGDVVLVEGNYDLAEAEAHKAERERGLTYISPYNDPRVIAGGGTVALELLERVPTLERIIVPVGGGGLISGISIAAKAIKPGIEIIGVNPAVAPVMYNHFYGLELPTHDESLADALPGAIEDDSLTLAIAQEYVDQIVLASEFDLERAVRWLTYECGWVAEGGGAAGAAVLLSESIHLDRETAVIISGGNIDADDLRRVLTD